MNKQGVCYQCSGLREVIPDRERRGDDVPDVRTLDGRLRVAGEADVDAGRSQRLHDLFWRRITAQERAGAGSTDPLPACLPGEDGGGEGT